MRFASRMEDGPAKRLFSIQQKGSIVAYINKFEELRALVKGIDESNLTHVFFNGLKPEMKEIKMKEPQGLRDHIAAVIKMEDNAFCRSVAAVSHQPYTGRSIQSGVSRSPAPVGEGIIKNQQGKKQGARQTRT